MTTKDPTTPQTRC